MPTPEVAWIAPTSHGARAPFVRRSTRARSSLDRLTPSLLDFATLVRWFEKAGSDLVVLRDPQFDTSTEQGRNLAVGLGAFARWQHGTTVERISEDLDAWRRQGLPISRPAVADDPQLLEFIRQLRDDGSRFRQIANELDVHGILTLRGGATVASIKRPDSVGLPSIAARPKIVTPAAPRAEPVRR